VRLLLQSDLVLHKGSVLFVAVVPGSSGERRIKEEKGRTKSGMVEDL
jgi:hypothetical protein